MSSDKQQHAFQIVSIQSLASACVGFFLRKTKRMTRFTSLSLFISVALLRHSHQTNITELLAANEYIVLTQNHVQLTTNNSDLRNIRSHTHAVAIEYDIKHDCIFLAYPNTIERQCMDNGSREVLVSYALHNVKDIEYDWLSETLYFTHGKPQLIEAIETSWRRPNVSDAWRRRIFNGSSDFHGNIRMTVHPKRGHLYFTGWHRTLRGAIYCMNLDGSNVRLLLSKPFVVQPGKIAIDHIFERIYWFDELKRCIASCDLNGLQLRVHYELMSKGHQMINHMTVYNGVVYFSDGKRINRPRSQDSSPQQLWRLNTNTVNAMRQRWWESTVTFDAFRVYGEQSQTGVNACADGRNNCTHLCVGAPDNRVACPCPDGMETIGDNECECGFTDDAQCLRRFINCTESGQIYCDGKCLHK